MPDHRKTWFLSTEEETSRLAAAGGRALQKVAVRGLLYMELEGELGAGKTCWVRGMLRGMGYEGRVVSPTYTLVEPYQAGGLQLLHLDLYRLSDPAELEFLGVADQAKEGTVMCVEWPRRAAGALPAPDLRMNFQYCGTGRRLDVQALTATGLKWLELMPEASAPMTDG